MSHESNQKIPQQVLFINDLEQMIGRNRLTLRRWWTQGKFPKPVKLNGTTLAWYYKTINSWIDNNIKYSLADSKIE